MTHTPGPWNYDKAGNDADQWLIYDANDRTIGLSYHGEDNARLFSTAPDLVAALEAIEALTPGGPHVSAKAAFEATLAVVGQARTIARAALAKAKGG